jgi:hypothetical protein
MLLRRSRTLAIIAAFGLAAAVVAAGRGAGAPALPSPTMPAATPITQVPGLVATSATPLPDWITVAGGSVWVANVGNSDSVGRFDRKTGRQVGTVRIGTAPNAICASMDSGFGALWVAHCSSNDLSRIDLTSGAVTATVALRPRQIAENSSVTAGEGSVFVLTAGRPKAIIRIDPATDSIANIFAAPDGATSLRVGAGGLWVSTWLGLTRLDPIHGTPVATIPLPYGGYYLAIGAGSVWMLSVDVGVITRVDPSDNSVIATIQVEQPGSRDHRDLAFGDGFLWARVADALVAQIDPATNTVVARYGPPTAGGGAVAVDNTAVWITSRYQQTVWRMPLSTARPRLHHIRG